MIIPEDGELPLITDSKSNIYNNIMIVKVDDEWKKPGETTYQLASLDRSKKGIVWPADSFVDKLFPDLFKVGAGEDCDQELDALTYKHTDNTTVGNNRKTFQRHSQYRYRSSGMRRPNTARRRNWNTRTENRRNRTKPKKDIDPWVHNPWDEPSHFNVPEVTSGMHGPRAPYSGPYDNFVSNVPNDGLLGKCPPSNDGLLGKCPPNEFVPGPSLLGDHPSANNNLEKGHYSGFDESQPSGDAFGPPEYHGGEPSNHSYKQYPMQRRGRPCSNKYSVHDSNDMMPYESYAEFNRDDYMCDNYSEFDRKELSANIYDESDAYNEFSNIQQSAQGTARKTYIPNPRHGPPIPEGPPRAPPFENNHMEPRRDAPHADIQMNKNFNEAPYRKPYPSGNNNTEQWRFNKGSSSRGNAGSAQWPNRRSWRGNRFKRAGRFRRGFGNHRNQRK